MLDQLAGRQMSLFRWGRGPPDALHQLDTGHQCLATVTDAHEVAYILRCRLGIPWINVTNWSCFPSPHKNQRDSVAGRNLYNMYASDVHTDSHDAIGEVADASQLRRIFL